jgi:hypothetical protein
MLGLSEHNQPLSAVSSSYYGSVFSSFPIEGEGWDGGGVYNQRLNPLPSPPPDRRRGLKIHNENCYSVVQWFDSRASIQETTLPILSSNSNT